MYSVDSVDSIDAVVAAPSVMATGAGGQLAGSYGGWEFGQFLDNFPIRNSGGDE